MFCLNDTMRYHLYSMTLDEFTQVFEAWQQERMYDTRTSWKQARFIAQCALMPYSKKGLKATDVVVFDWEKEEKHKGSTAKTTKEDIARILERFGDA